MPTAEEIIAALDLKPHPIEGGFFRETYRSVARTSGAGLPNGYPPGAERNLGTSIYYLLTSKTFSEMHRLPTEEVFHVYLGGPARMLQLFPDGRGRELILGTDFLGGESPQIVVPPGVWQGTALEPGADFILLGATMAPGFDYEDYEQGRCQELTGLYPEFAERIAGLTRQ